MNILMNKLLIVMAISGCAIVDGAPGESIEAGRDFNAKVINATLSASSLESALNDGVTVNERNEIIFARMAEIDVLYYEYESQITRELRDSNFVLALLGIGVGGAGSFASKGVSNILSAVSSGLTGAQQTFQKEVLVDRTIQAFQSQMRARRAAVRASILGKLESTVLVYPLQAAVSDLAAYRQAGTITDALLAIADNASENERTAKDNLTRAEKLLGTVAFGENKHTKVFETYIEDVSIGEAERERRTKLLSSLIDARLKKGGTKCRLPADGVMFSNLVECVPIQEAAVASLKAMGEI